MARHGREHPRGGPVCSRGASISTTRVIWVVVGLLNSAVWAAIVVVSKRMLQYIEPVAFNMFVRLIALCFMIVIGVPVTAAHLWSLDFDLSWTAFGYMAAMAFFTWLIAFNAYYYALRHGEVSIVGPVSSSDPVFTALFAFVFLGAAFGPTTIAGLLLTVAGVLLITRWMGAESGAVEEPAGAEVLLPDAGGQRDEARAADASADMAVAGTTDRPATRRDLRIIGLSVLCAASWGLAPLFIQAAMNDLGGPSLWLLMLSQGLGALILAPLVWPRRHRILIRAITPRERRMLIWLFVLSGLLEAGFSIVFYFVIEAIGAVLTTITVAASPVFTILAGVVFLKERPGKRLLFAAAVVLCGVFLAAVDGL